MPDVDDTAPDAGSAAAALREIGAAADRALDELAGLPDGGRIETFTHAGATIVAEKHGDPAAPTAFVLVHGIGMGRKVFGDLMRRLSGYAFVVAIDQPGYGEAPEPPRTPTMERTADLLAAYVRHLGLRGVVLIGHSMGTQVVTEMAVRHPDLAGALVLVGPTIDPGARSALAQLTRLGRDLLVESPKVLLLGAREYLRAGPNLRRKMRAMLVHRPEDAYPRVAAPTLVIRGAEDRVCPHVWCAQVAAAVPGARLFEVPGHGHETLIRDAGPAAAEVLAFVDAIRAAG